MAKKLLVLSLIPTEAAAAGQHRFRVLDPANGDMMMTVMASERDANRIDEGMIRPGARGPFWAEFRDAIVIEDRAPLPRELRDTMGVWQRTLIWRPRPHDLPRSSSNDVVQTSATSYGAGAAYVLATVASGVAVIGAQMYGVFGWLFLGGAIYLAGTLLLSWGLRYVPVDAAWKLRLEIGLPLPVVALIGFAARGMIHPAFAWSNGLMFFSR